jgi:hypothetical protein
VAKRSTRLNPLPGQQAAPAVRYLLEVERPTHFLVVRRVTNLKQFDHRDLLSYRFVRSSISFCPIADKFCAPTPRQCLVGGASIAAPHIFDAMTRAAARHAGARGTGTNLQGFVSSGMKSRSSWRMHCVNCVTLHATNPAIRDGSADVQRHPREGHTLECRPCPSPHFCRPYGIPNVALFCRPGRPYR